MLHFIKRLAENVFWLIVISACAYIFLGLCNWSRNIGDWNGFSRFLLALVVLIMVLATWEAMSNVSKTLRAKRK
jgi:hypothetical protein